MHVSCSLISQEYREQNMEEAILKAFLQVRDRKTIN